MQAERENQKSNYSNNVALTLKHLNGMKLPSRYVFWMKQERFAPLLEFY